ncbi:ABC transporter, ATP-binding protein [Enterococcus faecalis 13-SD-W-01]|nr:ABC transporter, ATP-binding protein [Enterococcus faecalis 13-SD-W-01]
MYAHFIQKAVSDCGIAVVRTILEQLNINISNIKELYKHYDFSNTQGISLGDMDNILKKYGVITSSYEVNNFEELKKVNKFPFVLVIENDGFAHYVVVHDYNNNQFTISNPAEMEITKYDEEKLKSVFLGYALCIDEVGAPESINEEYEDTKLLGDILYEKILAEISNRKKISMVILLMLKYVIPLAITFFIQSFTTQSIKTVFLTSFIVGIMFLTFYFVTIFENKQKITIENSIQKNVLMNYYTKKMNENQSNKNAENVMNYFWNLLMSVSGLLQKYYFKIHLVYVIFLVEILFYIQPIIAMTVLIIGALFALYMKRNLLSIQNIEQDMIKNSSKFASAVENNIQTSMDLHLFSKKESGKSYLLNKMEDYFVTRLKATTLDVKINNIFQLFTILVAFCTFLIVSLSISMGQNWLNSGNSILIITMIINSLSPLIQTWVSYQKSKVAIEFIQSTDDYSEMNIQSKTVISVAEIRTLSLKKVAFSYTHNEIFNKYSQSFERGKIYSILGKNGVGKSTLLKLITGLLENSEGVFILNGNEKYETFKNTNIQEYISMYSPEFDLYANSINRNIEYKVFNEELEDHNYQDILNLGLNGNYSLQVRGSNLSQGQKQKILLMRALRQDKSIYIFDEPSGNLDTKGRELLITQLQKLAHEKNKIVIIVSHDEEIVNIADEIVKL